MRCSSAHRLVVPTEHHYKSDAIVPWSHALRGAATACSRVTCVQQLQTTACAVVCYHTGANSLLLDGARCFSPLHAPGDPFHT